MKKSAFNLQHQNSNTESKIVAALERIAQAFRVLLWNESREYSVSPIQVQLLIFLLHHNREKRKITYLADEFNMTKATISDAVKSLEEKLLIKKEYEPADTRSYIIQLTKKGQQVAEKVSFFTEELQVPVEKLHPSDKENILLSLLGIIRHLNQSGVITIQRMCFQCTHYKAANNGKVHFCKLLNQKLETTDLRIDCPEYETAG
jgi:DNA-binding MarR family transcriptional regulator